MTCGELKSRIMTVVNNLIDIYFGEGNVVDSLTNSTLKIIVKTNIDKLDDLLVLFADKDGEIDADSIIEAYASNIGIGGTQFDLRDYVQSDFIKGLLPDKKLIVTKEDVLKIVQG